MPPREPPSYANSVQSSTIPGEGASILSNNNAKMGLHTPSGSINSRPSRPENHGNNSSATKGGIPHKDRRSVISVVSEFKQDSVELDEQVPNARIAKHDKLENLLGKKGGANSGRKGESGLPMSGQMLDLSIP